MPTNVLAEILIQRCSYHNKFIALYTVLSVYNTGLSVVSEFLLLLFFALVLNL